MAGSGQEPAQTEALAGESHWERKTRSSRYSEGRTADRETCDPRRGASEPGLQCGLPGSSGRGDAGFSGDSDSLLPLCAKAGEKQAALGLEVRLSEKAAGRPWLVSLGNLISPSSLTGSGLHSRRPCQLPGESLPPPCSQQWALAS